MVMKVKVVKILNNSLVLSKDDNGQEIIVMGKGLGFKSKEGDTIPEAAIEKVFVPNDRHSRQEYIHLLQSIPKEHLEAINDSLERMKAYWTYELDQHATLMLFDHLAFAIERTEKGIILQNKLLNEIRLHYPEEFTAAMVLLSDLNKLLPMELPEEEAGNIAFHLVNARNEEAHFENTILAVSMLKDIQNIVRYQLNITLNPTSTRYNRFITHLQYYIRRLMEDQQLNSKDVLLFDRYRSEYPEEYQCAQSISTYGEKMTGKPSTDEEVFYLLIHLIRFTNYQDQ